MATMPNVHSHGYWLVKTHVDIMALETAVEIFILDNKRIPNISEGLDILVDLPKNVNLPNWKGYLPSVRKDHWGSKYIYRDQKSNKKLFQIYSSGPDGVDNAGMGDDVVLWDKDYNCALYNDCYTLKDHINRISTITAVRLTIE